MIGTGGQVKSQEKLLVEEHERRRTSEADLRHQLSLRNRECEALQLQLAELETKIQCLRGTTQRLQSQLEAQQREYKSDRQRNKAVTEYWNLHNEVQQFVRRNQDRPVDEGSPPLHPPPESWFEAENENNIAARQVVTREHPTFSGDPIDWPLFISSYQHSTQAFGYTNSENLLRLQRSLKGSAKDSVSSFLLHPSTVPQVMSTLQQLYGRPGQIVNNMITKVRATPPPKPDRLDTLVSFGLIIQNLCGHLKAVGLEKHLANPILLQELVDKLPATVKFSWALYQEQVQDVDLNVFSSYMARISSAASSVTQMSNIPQKSGKDEKGRLKERSFVNTHVSTDKAKVSRQENAEKAGVRGGKPREKDAAPSNTKSCSVCNVDSHQIDNCSSFKGLDLDGRWKAVKANKLCARCLTSHARWPCKGEVCVCPKRHHRLLHFEPPMSSKTTSAVVTAHRQLSSSTLFRILPVTLFGKQGQFNTFAFLDDGSSVTLVVRPIADALGASGEVKNLNIEWTGSINKTIAGTEVVTMEISEAGGNRRFRLSEVYTVDSLGLPQQTTDYAELANRYAHLNKLPVKSFRCAVPGILIGQSNVQLLATLRLREGELNEPIATKTRIGWAVCGNVRKPQASTVYKQLHIHAEPSVVDLHEYVRRFFDIESMGVAVVPAVRGVEEQRANNILETITRRLNDKKYETGLLWKHDYVEFPDSRPMAERRFKYLEYRLAQNPQLYESVRQQKAESKDKGFIHEATVEEMEEFDLRRTWFLPIGVVADIKEMFLQISIRKEDCSAPLFQYRDSPDVPMKQEAEFPRGAAAVKKRHYVDDYVNSHDTAEEAIEVAKEVIEVHKRVGFHIRNWMSSDRSVVEKLGEANQKPSKDMLSEKDVGQERVLGMAWIQREDICLRIFTAVWREGPSIPRLELMATVLGARLRKTIEENHTLKIQKTFFWSDSTTVCSWIESETRRYRQFVSFRVDEILSNSSIDEWQWISTKINVADEATKWGKGPSCNVDSRWFQGPEFHYGSKAGWSMIPEEDTDESDKELREAYVFNHHIRQPVIDTSKFSRFERMLRSVAYVPIM
ncbi:uncharacterized protein LOC134206502 [Armigeres subalbatus]|uniref:uncharacterized protein LOC134206502 n=1 Tax=Armigeres subalbatus TaxID=124917 RepID=UPI002ED59026